MTVQVRQQPADSNALPSCAVCGQNAWSGCRPATRLRTCRSCGTLFNDRSATRQDEEKRYQTYTQDTTRDAPLIGASQWHWVRRALLPAREAASLAVLDIGCGYGDFLKSARRDGARVQGVELDPSAAAACLRDGLPVAHGSILDVGVPQGPWDVITIWDVLEMVEDPVAVLRPVARELAPGGVLVLRGRHGEIHAKAKVIFRRFEKAARRLGVPDVSVVHRWGLTPSGYSALMEQVGLDQIRLYPGVPTPGDRAGALGPRLLASAIKGTISGVGTAIQHGSLGRLYPFPSVLIAGKKPARRG
jgi:SAM-dependent methyltransferase